ncbi:unnamed protein product, partial [Meganyctiphanes norvegica]
KSKCSKFEEVVPGSNCDNCCCCSENAYKDHKAENYCAAKNGSFKLVKECNNTEVEIEIKAKPETRNTKKCCVKICKDCTNNEGHKSVCINKNKNSTKNEKNKNKYTKNKSKKKKKNKYSNKNKSKKKNKNKHSNKNKKNKKKHTKNKSKKNKKNEHSTKNEKNKKKHTQNKSNYWSDMKSRKTQKKTKRSECQECILHGNCCCPECKCENKCKRNWGDEECQSKCRVYELDLGSYSDNCHCCSKMAYE